VDWRRHCSTALIAIVAATFRSDAESRIMAEFGTLAATIVSNLTPDERERSAVYLNETIHPPGTATLGMTRIEIDYPYVLAFIDRRPGANWMHPCRYLIVNPSDQALRSVDSDRPPAFGILPSTWKLIARSPGLEDWQLMKIEPVDERPP